jgi:glycerophosphoryl diester phosphodiesterase
VGARGRSRRRAWEDLGWPLLWGHRGSRTTSTENTVDALGVAAGAGADGVEIDVRLCGSGEIVVVHDPDLARITRGRDRRSVSALALEELTSVDLGHGERVATLDQVVQLCRDRHLALNVEMKRDVPDRARLVRAVGMRLSGVDLEQPLVVSCFDPAMLGLLAVVAPELPRALLVHPDHLELAMLGWPLGAVALHPARTIVRTRWVEHWRNQGRRAVAWTVNDPREARELLSAGFDGIISDDPAALRHLFPTRG